MKRIITLKDCAGLPVHHSEEWAPHILREARSTLEFDGLRFDNRTGRIRDNSGLIEKYSNSQDFSPHPDIESVMRWEFSRHINNAASRVHRGFKAS